LTNGKSARTQNAALGLWRTFLEWCVRQGYLPTDPLANIRKAKDSPEQRPYRRRAFTGDELKRLLKVAPMPRRLVYAVAAFTGFRRSTLGRLERQHLDVSDTSRPLWRLEGKLLKGKRPATLPVSPDAMAWLTRRPLDEMGSAVKLLPAPPMMRTFYKDMTAAGLARKDEAGRHLVFHSFRYFACTQWAKTLPIQKVKVLMCHRTLAMTSDLYCQIGLDDVGGEM